MDIDYFVVSGRVNKKADHVYVWWKNNIFRVIISFIINLYSRYKLLFNRIHFNLFRKFDDGLL